MLNTAIPTLQIKLRGVDLSNIQTMNVILKGTNSTITKDDANIEVNNDVITVFLTKTEANSLNENLSNISILATDMQGIDVSKYIKVIWAKRASMSKSVGNSDNFPPDALEDYYTKQEVNTLLEEIPKGQDGITPTIGENGNWYLGTSDTGMPSRGEKGEKGDKGGNLSEQEIQGMIDESMIENLSGVKIAQSSEGKWGYIPPGADTVIPFKEETAGDNFVHVVFATYIDNPSYIDMIGIYSVYVKENIMIANGYEQVLN